MSIIGDINTGCLGLNAFADLVDAKAECQVDLQLKIHASQVQLNS